MKTTILLLTFILSTFIANSQLVRTNVKGQIPENTYYGLKLKNQQILKPEYFFVEELENGNYVYSNDYPSDFFILRDYYIPEDEIYEKNKWITGSFEGHFLFGIVTTEGINSGLMYTRIAVLENSNLVLKDTIGRYWSMSKSAKTTTLLQADSVGFIGNYQVLYKKDGTSNLFGNNLEKEILKNCSFFSVEDYGLRYVKNDKFGLVSNEGESLLENEFDYIGRIYEWEMIEKKANQQQIVGDLNQSKWDYFNYEYDPYGARVYRFPGILLRKDDKFGLIDDSENRTVLDTDFLFYQNHRADAYSQTLFLKFFDDGGFVHLVDTGLNVVDLETSYADINMFFDLQNQKYIAQKDGLWGVLDENFKPLTTFGYDTLYKSPTSYVAKPEDAIYIGKDSNNKVILLNQSCEPIILGNNYDSFVYDKYNFRHLVSNNGKYGLLDKGYKEVLEPVYDTLFYYDSPKGEEYIQVKLKGKWGIYDLKNKRFIARPDYAEIEPKCEKENIAYRKEGKLGYLNLKTGKSTSLDQVSDRFKEKWKVYVGLTSYRTNIIEEGGKIYIGSNGGDYEDTTDQFDGAYEINARDGKITRHFKPISNGDNDVNGVAVYKDRIFFGNDNKQFFCYNLAGDLIWSYETLYDSEGCPSLADLNGDGYKDIIFTTELYGVTALDGKTGEEIWKKINNGKGGRIFSSPSLYDLNNDGVLDVVVASTGIPSDTQEVEYDWLMWNHSGGYIWAINGSTGEFIWTTPTITGRWSSTILDAENKFILMGGSSYRVEKFDLTGELSNTYHLKGGKASTPLPDSNSERIFWSLASPYNCNGGVNSIRMDQSYKTDEDKKKTKPMIEIGSRVSASPVIADVFGDETMEVIYLSEDGEFIVLNEKGELLEILGMPAGAEATCFVKDIDKDGKLEILIAGLDGYLRCYDTKSKGQIFWGQFRGDNDNSGTIRRTK